MKHIGTIAVFCMLVVMYIDKIIDDPSLADTIANIITITFIVFVLGIKISNRKNKNINKQ